MKSSAPAARMEPFASVHFDTVRDGTKPRFPHHLPTDQSSSGDIVVSGRLYFTRQAAFLLKFAKATSNPELAAVLVQKAADLKAQTDAPRQPSEDKSPVAPDVE